jgi:hypothetical protein
LCVNRYVALAAPGPRTTSAMPDSSSLTLIVNDESPRVNSQAVRCEAAPGIATSGVSARARAAVSGRRWRQTNDTKATIQRRFFIPHAAA